MLGLNVVTPNWAVKDYAENEYAADQKYKGRAHLVRGKVRRITSGFRDEPIVIFQSDQQFKDPQASFRTIDSARISALRRGQKLDLMCVGSGEVMGTPMFKNCAFADVALRTLIDTLVDEQAKQLATSPEDIDSFALKVFALSRGMASFQPSDLPCFTDPYGVGCANEFVFAKKDAEKRRRIHAAFAEAQAAGIASAWRRKE
ncbi:tRNA-anti-like protein [compost metagenome]